MSILIKGVEMPTTERVWTTIRIYHDGSCALPNWQGDCTFIEGAQAIPVIPHGRLIDGSANALILEKKLEEANADFMANLDDEYLEGVRDGISECVKTIWFAETIIPASEGEKA